MKWVSTRLVLRISLAGVLLGAAACAPAAAPPSLHTHALAGPWAFQPGDDLRWALPEFDDGAWPRLLVPGSWRRQGFGQFTGLAWYRLRVEAPWPREDLLGVSLGKIDSAYELYAGGRRLGGVGKLPPAARMEYDRHRTYAIPPDARELDGSIVLALRVWRDPMKTSPAAGPVEGPFEIGPLGRLIERGQIAEAQQLALVLLFLAVALYHLSLRIRLGSGSDYFWFGILALLASVYGFLRSQWKYLVLDDFLVLKKVEHVVIWLVPPILLQFLYVFFRQPMPRLVRAAQALLVAGAVFILLTPGLLIPLAALAFLQLVTIPVLAVLLMLVVRRIAAGDAEARIVGFGIAVLAAAIVHDALVDRNYIVNLRIAVHGFTILVIGMSLTLGNRFQRAIRDRDALLRDLEARVDARTIELRDAFHEMEALALRDGLTQLANRRAMQDRARGELARARRHGIPFAIAMIDVDHFKAINDTHGHAAGDRVLIEIAKRLRSTTRTSDDVGRWGGEEFIVLMPSTTPADAAAGGDRLRRVIEAAPIVIADGVAHRVTASVGIATALGGAAETADLDSLLRLADDALYRAKAAGRNTTRGAEIGPAAV